MSLKQQLQEIIFKNYLIRYDIGKSTSMDSHAIADRNILIRLVYLQDYKVRDHTCDYSCFDNFNEWYTYHFRSSLDSDIQLPLRDYNKTWTAFLYAKKV